MAWRSAALAAVTAATLAGCGFIGSGDESAGPNGEDSSAATEGDSLDARAGSGDSAEQILTALAASTQQAKSVTVGGTAEIEGTSQNITISGFRGSADRRITISAPDAGAAEITVVGEQYFISADEAFWKKQLGTFQGTLAAGFLKGKYVKIPADQASRFDLPTMDALFSTLKLADLEHLKATYTSTEETTVNGTPAMKLSDPQNSSEYLTVTADSEHRLLQVMSAAAPGTASGKAELMTFSDWNAVPAITAPPADKVVER